MTLVFEILVLNTNASTLNRNEKKNILGKGRGTTGTSPWRTVNMPFCLPVKTFFLIVLSFIIRIEDRLYVLPSSYLSLILFFGCPVNFFIMFVNLLVASFIRLPVWPSVCSSTKLSFKPHISVCLPLNPATWKHMSWSLFIQNKRSLFNICCIRKKIYDL